MKITVTEIREAKKITLNIEKFDINNMQELKGEIQNEINEAEINILLDFSKVNFMDSSGLSVVIAIFKQLTALDKKLEICGLQEQPMELIEITQLHKVFTIIDSCK